MIKQYSIQVIYVYVKKDSKNLVNILVFLGFRWTKNVIKEISQWSSPIIYYIIWDFKKENLSKKKKKNVPIKNYFEFGSSWSNSILDSSK